jgi:hypothetical protein
MPDRFEELLLRCENAYCQIYNETISLLATCDELIEGAKSKPSIPSLPQVAELEERVGSFLGSAKRCLEKTHALLGTFYDCPRSWAKLPSVSRVDGGKPQQ